MKTSATYDIRILLLEEEVMVAPELRSRARRYGYTGKAKEQMLADLTTEGDVGTALALSSEWQRARAKVKNEKDPDT